MIFIVNEKIKVFDKLINIIHLYLIITANFYAKNIHIFHFILYA